MTTMTLDDNDKRVLLRLLKRKGKRLQMRIDGKNWSPPPGQIDVDIATLDTINRLIDRIGPPPARLDGSPGHVPEESFGEAVVTKRSRFA